MWKHLHTRELSIPPVIIPQHVSDKFLIEKKKMKWFSIRKKNCICVIKQETVKFARQSNTIKNNFSFLSFLFILFLTSQSVLELFFKIYFWSAYALSLRVNFLLVLLLLFFSGCRWFVALVALFLFRSHFNYVIIYIKTHTRTSTDRINTTVSQILTTNLKLYAVLLFLL